MNVMWVFSYLTDSVFMYLYFRRITYSPAEQHTWLKPVLLLIAMPLYLNTTVLAIPYAAVRILLRMAVYFLWCWYAEGVPWKVSLYAAIFWTTAYTLFQNIFFGPYLNGIFMESVDIFVSHMVNQIFFSVVNILLRILFFGSIAKLLPFVGTVGIEETHIFVAALLCFASGYIKRTGSPLVGEFKNIPAQFTVYYIMMHAALLSVLIAMEIVRRKTVESASLSVQSTAAQALLEKIKEQQNNEEALRALRHDLKNHAISLQLLLESGETDEAMAYLAQLRSQTSGLTPKYNTGNPLLDGLLNLKLALAEEKGVQTNVRIDFRQGEFIESFDLCVIMGNLLDNAVEACLRIKPLDSAYIGVTGGVTANQLLIRIENTYSGIPIRSTSILTSTKGDASLHGFGLRNVRNMVKKYNGTFLLSAENRLFVVSVLIPIPDKEPNESQ